MHQWLQAVKATT